MDLTHPKVGELLARCSFPPAGSEIDVAVSGGPDSLALLVLAVAAGCEVTAHHVDHGLRAGSASEAEVVAAVAEQLGAGFVGHHVDVGDGPNLEARARAARRAVLPPVMTGHTADDRAETVLLNLLRGAGPDGLAGISPSPWRPLLGVRRADTEALCAALGLEPVDDPSNRDPRFRRNRVRHELIPLLADIGQRDPVPVLARQADLMEGVIDVVHQVEGFVEPTDARALAAAPPSVAGAVVRRWLIDQGVGDGYGVDHASVVRVLAVARGECIATEVAGGWRVARSGGRLSVTGPGPWQDAAHD